MEIKDETKKLKSGSKVKVAPELLPDQGTLKSFGTNGSIEEILGNKAVEKAKEQQQLKSKEFIEKSFVRVGDQYYKEVNLPDKLGRTRRVHLLRQKGTIIDDYGRQALKWVKKYEAFCCVASHTDYKQVIENCYNAYHPLSHVPKEGEFDTILGVLKHVFNDKIEFALDYLQLLYTRPTQRLPIILLESREKNTGKSTFGNLLKMMFQDNAIKLGNSDFESDFNEIWISSLSIIVDETSLNKTSIMPMLKRLSTETNKVTSNAKNKAQIQVEFIGKFLFMSNDEGKALLIERGDNRFAVFKVPTLQESGLQDNPNIEDEILKEIPAFLDYLVKRQLYHKETGRMYFSTDAYFTKQLQVYFEGSQSYLARSIQDFITGVFTLYPDVPVLHYSVSDLIDQMLTNKFITKIPDRQQMKQALESDLSMKPGPRQRYELYSFFDSENNLNSTTPKSGNNVTYEFRKENY